MARSLLRQLEQIRQSATYSDNESNIHVGGIVENTTLGSGSLQQDLNFIRTALRDVKFGMDGPDVAGTDKWFDDLGKYWDPTNTTSGTAELKDMNMSNIKGHTTDAQTVILAVQTNNAGGTYYTVSGTDTGVLLTGANSDINTFVYATAADRRGLPIFASTANAGSYWDEGGSDRVVRVDVLSSDDVQLQDNSGNTIYAKFHDGADFGATGSGTDVYVRFYANDAVTDLQNVMVSASGTLGTDTIDLYFITPERRVLKDVAEWEWMRTDFVSSWEGDIELIEDIMNLWAFTGSGDGVSSAATWTNATGNYPLSSNPGDLWTAIDLLNTAGGDATYTEDNYVTDGESYASSIDALDQALKDVEDSISAGVAEKYIEEAAALISTGVEHSLPTGLSYTPTSVSGAEGANMDVYVGGQLLAASTGANGVNADRDYAETSASGITFHFDVQAGRNITYMIRQ